MSLYVILWILWSRSYSVIVSFTWCAERSLFNFPSFLSLTAVPNSRFALNVLDSYIPVVLHVRRTVAKCEIKLRFYAKWTESVFEDRVHFVFVRNSNVSTILDTGWLLRPFKPRLQPRAFRCTLTAFFCKEERLHRQGCPYKLKPRVQLLFCAMATCKATAFFKVYVDKIFRENRRITRTVSFAAVPVSEAKSSHSLTETISTEKVAKIIGIQWKPLSCRAPS